MKRTLIATIGVAAAIILGSAANSETETTKALVSPSDIKWGPAPASLPAGAEAALLYGDPTKEGVFALRIRIPKDYQIPPHTHPKAEVVTILSGKFNVGMGPKADRTSTQSLGAGAFMAMPPQVAHYVFSDEETVLQITSDGPWAIDYIDPKDDPRLNVAPRKEGM
jgi:quercetin dioxygenase-like cupin family protein